MKKIIVIFALFMLVKPIVPLLEYVVFYDYIKNELCVNKKDMAMKCNGKCHLKKELAKASESSEKQDKNNVRTFSVETNAVFFQDFYYLKWNIYEKDLRILRKFYYINFYTYQTVYSIFHPPLIA